MNTCHYCGAEFEAGIYGAIKHMEACKGERLKALRQERPMLHVGSFGAAVIDASLNGDTKKLAELQKEAEQRLKEQADRRKAKENFYDEQLHERFACNYGLSDDPTWTLALVDHDYGGDGWHLIKRNQSTYTLQTFTSGGYGHSSIKITMDIETEDGRLKLSDIIGCFPSTAKQP